MVQVFRGKCKSRAIGTWNRPKSLWLQDSAESLGQAGQTNRRGHFRYPWGTDLNMDCVEYAIQSIWPLHSADWLRTGA